MSHDIADIAPVTPVRLVSQRHRHLKDAALDPLLAGDATPEDLAEIAALVESCPICQARLVEVRGLDRALSQEAVRLRTDLADQSAWPSAPALDQHSAPTADSAPGIGALHEVIVPSPIGRLRLVASERGLCEVDFLAETDAAPAPSASALSHPVLDATRQQLDEYFGGRRTEFDLPLDLRRVGAFHQQVLAATARIPFGGVVTYGRMAFDLGRPRAARAVGGALHRNPLPIVIPCHRIIGTNGSLVGYGGGLPIKRYLLSLEGVLSA